MDKFKENFKDKKKRNRYIYIVLLILAAVSAFFYFSNKGEVKEKSFTSFINFSKTDDVKNLKDVVVNEEAKVITYTLKGEEYSVKTPRNYFTENKEILDVLSKNKVDVEFKADSTDTVANVGEIFRLIVFIILFYIIFKMVADSFSSVDIKEVENEKTTFDDIAGYEYVKEELQEIVDFLNNPKDYEKYTDRIPKGVLLEGPPGNGKTLFAKAVAGESKTPFFQISASDIEDKYVGSGAKRVAKIFKTVRKKAEENGKVILFIDEIDAVGMKRESRTVQETNQTINKLLTEMDGFDKDTKVVIIAATNLSSVLDAALTRSGRFDRIIGIERPSKKEREAVIELYLRKKGKLVHHEVHEQQYAYVLAQQTEGFANADLDKLVNEASLIAKKKKESYIHIKTLREAFTKIVAGVQTSHSVSDEDKKIIAYHEAGHAMAQIMTSPEGYKGVAYVTITPHGKSLGHVSPVSGERMLLRKSDLRNQIMVKLAGRAVEERILNGDYTTGAVSDLQQANLQLLAYTTKYGMSNEFENLFIEHHDENNEFTQKLMTSIRNELYQDTKDLVRNHFDIVEKIAEHLLVHTSIEQNELPGILHGTSYERAFFEEGETL